MFEGFELKAIVGSNLFVIVIVTVSLYIAVQVSLFGIKQSNSFFNFSLNLQLQSAAISI